MICGGVDSLWRVCPRAHDEGRYDMSWLSPFGSVLCRTLPTPYQPKHACRALIGFWVAVCKVRGWQCAKGGRGVCDSGASVTLMEAWMVCCAFVHMMRVGMMRRGFLSFDSVHWSIGFQQRPLGVGCERRDQHEK
jgi:hypothetical protein